MISLESMMKKGRTNLKEASEEFTGTERGDGIVQGLCIATLSGLAMLCTKDWTEEEGREMLRSAKNAYEILEKLSKKYNETEQLKDPYIFYQIVKSKFPQNDKPTTS